MEEEEESKGTKARKDLGCSNTKRKAWSLSLVRDRKLYEWGCRGGEGPNEARSYFIPRATNGHCWWYGMEWHDLIYVPKVHLF